MEQVVLYCPNCRGHVLAADSQIGNLPVQRLPGHDYYCPSCEMFVNAVSGPGSDEKNPAMHPEDAPLNEGRSRTGGTNAGGSQRGDLSDQGATQWRRDPSETERNTWSDKR